MVPDTIGTLFKCSKCRMKAMTIYRWENNTPLGVCHSCQVARELTTEELQMIITRRICDRPGCGAEIPEGTGQKLNMWLNGIVCNIGDELSVDDTTDEPSSDGLEWELCDDCVKFFTELVGNAEITRKLFISFKQYGSRAKVEESEVDTVA